MKKKIILSSILLLGLLLGCYTTTYASYYELTDNDIDIICDNNFGENTTWSNLFYDKIKALKDEFYSYNYDLIIINMYSSYYHQVDVFGTASSRIAGVNNLNNKNYMEIVMQGNGIKASIVPNGYNAVRVDRSSLSSPNTYPVGSGAQNRSNYLLYTNDLGTSGTGPYQNLEWLELTPPTIFEIELNIDSNTKYFNITTEYGNTINNIPVISENPFGTFYDNTYIYYIADTLTMWYFDGVNWREKTIFHQVKDRVLLSNNDYMSYNYTNGNDYQETLLTLNNLYKYENVVYHYTITNNQLDVAEAFFLFGNSNTIINNNTIDTSNFGSDYYNQFKDLDIMINDNNNTSNVIDSINDGNNNIISALTSTDFSGDIGSGDFINYNVVDPTANFFDFLLGGISTIFLNNEEVYLPVNIPYISTETYYLSSDFFKVTGPLLLLFNFLWVSFIIVPKINEVHEVIKTINMGYTDAFISYFGYGISINDLL